MYRFFLTAVDVVPAAVVLVPVFVALHATAYGYDLRKSVFYCVFCLYLSAVFSLVGIPNVTYFRPELNLNLIPFAGMAEDLKNCLLNVLLFIPLGLFLPLLWKPFRRMIPSVTFGFGLSVIIECLQILTFRATDVNDIITNVAGTILGFLLMRPFVKRIPAVEKGSRDVYVLSILSFGVMFFVHPLLSPLIWDRIL